jgi:hypothetical protein
MSDKITYFLGAGASANGVPIVEKFNEQISLFIGVIGGTNIKDEKYTGHNASIEISKKQLRDEFIKDSQLIINRINSNHTTVDNYARMLYLTQQHRELRKLKSLLQSYLLWVQFNFPSDKRYDLFLATIFNLNKTSDELELPNSIQVITWNYDIQFEIAAEQYYQTDVVGYLQKSLGTTFNRNLEPIKAHNGFCIIRLNGNAIAWYEREMPSNFEMQFSKNRRDKTEFIESLLAYYYWLGHLPNGSGSAGINYAWEERLHTNKIREVAFDKAEKTTILVIIGYSFPTFNRSIDRELISRMKNLTKVYIQTMKDSVSEVKDRFKALVAKEIEIIPIEMNSGKEEFYIPFEYIGK